MGELSAMAKVATLEGYGVASGYPMFPEWQEGLPEPSATARVATLEGYGVDSRQVEVHQAYFKVMRAETAQKRKEAEKELATVLARRHAADVKFGKIASVACEIAWKSGAADCVSEEMLEGPVEAVKDVACHKAALESAVEHCGSFTDYSLRYSRLFVNLCETGMGQQLVKASIEKGCGQAVVV